MSKISVLLERAFAKDLKPKDAAALIEDLSVEVVSYDEDRRRRFALARAHALNGRDDDARKALCEPDEMSPRVLCDDDPSVSLPVIAEVLALAHRLGVGDTSRAERAVVHFLAGETPAFEALVREAVAHGEPPFEGFLIEQYCIHHEDELAKRFKLPYDGDRGPLESALMEKTARAVLKVGPDPRALMALGEVEFWDGRDKEAVEHLAEAAALVKSPQQLDSFHKAWLTKAKAHLRRGERDEALASLKAAFDHVATMKKDPERGWRWQSTKLADTVWDDFGFSDFRKDPGFMTSSGARGRCGGSPTRSAMAQTSDAMSDGGCASWPACRSHTRRTGTP